MFNKSTGHLALLMSCLLAGCHFVWDVNLDRYFGGGFKKLTPDDKLKFKIILKNYLKILIKSFLSWISFYKIFFKKRKKLVERKNSPQI